MMDKIICLHIIFKICKFLKCFVLCEERVQQQKPGYHLICLIKRGVENLCFSAGAQVMAIRLHHLKVIDLSSKILSLYVTKKNDAEENLSTNGFPSSWQAR